jgi:hypothetical protein
VTYCNLVLVKVITSVFNTANRFYYQTVYKKEENTSFSKKIKREDVCNYNKTLNDRLISSSDNISDLDLNFLENDDDNKYIFLLSSDTNNDTSKDKPVSTLLLYNTDMFGKDLYSSITFTKAI